mmetsp:Transcript_10496/g.24326  ORF Transcript_10496/g.24326 Transcript_10496/m.24326 type:complete len:126 (+) Transcript_10496:669-1046(+)
MTFARCKVENPMSLARWKKACACCRMDCSDKRQRIFFCVLQMIVVKEEEELSESLQERTKQVLSINDIRTQQQDLVLQQALSSYLQGNRFTPCQFLYRHTSILIFAINPWLIQLHIGVEQIQCLW